METVEGAVSYLCLEELSIDTFQIASHRHHVLPRHQSSLNMIALPLQMMLDAAVSLLPSYCLSYLISPSQELDF